MRAFTGLLELNICESLYKRLICYILHLSQNKDKYNIIVDNVADFVNLIQGPQSILLNPYLAFRRYSFTDILATQ